MSRHIPQSIRNELRHWLLGNESKVGSLDEAREEMLHHLDDFEAIEKEHEQSAKKLHTVENQRDNYGAKLLELEWSVHDQSDAFCPECGKQDERGHDEGCVLGKLCDVIRLGDAAPEAPCRYRLQVAALRRRAQIAEGKVAEGHVERLRRGYEHEIRRHVAYAAEERATRRELERALRQRMYDVGVSHSWKGTMACLEMLIEQRDHARRCAIFLDGSPNVSMWERLKSLKRWLSTGDGR
jgi:hypothetical protein